MFDVGVRVVREDGTFQDYAPDPDRELHADAERVVLYLADRHFRAVLPGPWWRDPAPPTPPEPVDESLLTVHDKRPWTWDGLTEATHTPSSTRRRTSRSSPTPTVTPTNWSRRTTDTGTPSTRRWESRWTRTARRAAGTTRSMT
ncbi:hypothetical protein NKH18_45245 [Streptomyces sp. M10(2022)]